MLGRTSRPAARRARRQPGFDGCGRRTARSGASSGGAGSRSMAPTRGGRRSRTRACSTSSARSTRRRSRAPRCSGSAYWPNYHYYHGHVMWDIETFTLPPLLLLAPDAAHALLDYRFRHLAAAQHNAALHGWRGAMYPWESCPHHGEESTPGARPYTEDHVSRDIALAFASYVHATGDRDYARRVAWPVLRSVAELWCRASSGRGVASRSATPSARASSTSRSTTTPSPTWPRPGSSRRRDAAPSAIGEPAAALVRDRRRAWSCRATARGAIINHDGARLDEPQGGVPEAPPAYFRSAIARRPTVELATYRYAALEQAPLYVGAPMLSALLPVYAARAGEPALAATCWSADTATSSTSRSWSPTSTRGPNRPTPGVADVRQPQRLSHGTALRLHRHRSSLAEPDAWCERPVVLPQGWKGVHIERVWIRGQPWQLDAVPGGKPAKLAPVRSLTSSTRLSRVATV